MDEVTLRKVRRSFFSLKWSAVYNAMITSRQNVAIFVVKIRQLFVHFEIDRFGDNWFTVRRGIETGIN